MVRAVIICFFLIVSGYQLGLAQIPGQSSDADALGIISMIDQIEIQGAQLAAQKHLSPQVLAYAKMLNKEHSANLTATEQLAQQLNISIPDNTPAILHLKNSGEEDLAALDHLDGEAFAQLYIADMIKGHSDALNWIESQGAQNQQVKDFLNDTHQHISKHLDMAHEIQKHQSIGQTQS